MKVLIAFVFLINIAFADIRIGGDRDVRVINDQIELGANFLKDYISNNGNVLHVDDLNGYLSDFVLERNVTGSRKIVIDLDQVQEIILKDNALTEINQSQF